MSLDLRTAQMISGKVQNQYKKTIEEVDWTEVYNNEDEIVEDLNMVHIPKESELHVIGQLYKGYEYIHSFAWRVQSEMALSAKQMIQAKRLALEIKKAASICGCWK